ncbi:MAG: tRNA dihydrouridine synthase DusB [Verrucomicrobiota bacterium]
MKWLSPQRPPLYLAPMAGITDLIFRDLCKEQGAEVMVTEFVSAEGILQADERTRKYTEFEEGQRPVGVQLFGADGTRMGEAARKIIDWKQPDFIDINFGCPVNKVVAKNGGSSLLRDCPLLTSVAEEIVRAVEPTGIPVTAKIRIGWDSQSINAPQVVGLLEGCGIQAVTIHGRTRAQGYSGEADWEVIGDCAELARIPIIGNGDLRSGHDVQRRLQETKVRGVMIGRAAMQRPWLFREARHYLETGTQMPEPSAQERWGFIRRHCAIAIEQKYRPTEELTLMSMRSRLMAYSKGLPFGKNLRQQFSHLSSLTELEDIAATHLADLEKRGEALAAQLISLPS